MRRLILSTILILCIKSSQSQLSTYEWSNMVGSSSTAKKALLDGVGNTYVWATDNYLVKYNSSGGIVWSRQVQLSMHNISLNSDSTAILICGYLQSGNTNVDFGNGVSTGAGYYSAGVVLRVDGSNGNSQWIKSYDPLVPFLSTATAISAVYEVNNRIFTVQGTKMRRLDTNGNEVWNRVIIYNGTTYSLENRNFNSFADANGNTFFAGVSDMGNTTSLTLNGVTYTTFGNNNVYRTYISLDSNGNTNWIRLNVNFQGGKTVEVTREGDVVMAGGYIYSSSGLIPGVTNHPFMPDYCNRDYNIFRANLKTGSIVWNSYSQITGNVNTAGYHLASDGNLYIYCLVPSASEFITKVGTVSRTFIPLRTAPNNYILRINANGVPDSAFTVNTFSGSSVGTFDFAVMNLFRTNQGKFIYLFNKKNNAMNFANGNANLNTSTNAYGGIVQFVPPAIAPRHVTTWTGTTDGGWFTATNWSNGIPTDSSNVIVTPNAANYPQFDFQLYNYSTNQWAKCGNLMIQPDATFYFGYGGTRVEGTIFNEGTLVYKNLLNYSNPDFTAWSNTIGGGFIVGNGTIKYIGGTAATVAPFKSGNNTFEVTLDNDTDSLTLKGCNVFKNINLVKGKVVFDSYYGSRLYVDSNFRFTPPARMYGGFISTMLRNNQSFSMPLGDAAFAQPATITLFNSATPTFVTSSFSNIIGGASPNPNNCIVNGVGISTILNRGIWTINAATPLAPGAYYNASFNLRGSTNSASSSRYALLKRNNSSSNWQVAGTYNLGKDSAGYAISSATNISSFSDFAIGLTDAPLPIHSIQLFVTKQQQGNQLSWKIIATQANGIEVEKSVDGRTFTAIANLPYMANGGFTDLASTGKNYYRVKVTDLDGIYKFSNVVWISSNDRSTINVYPTLFTSNFTVQNNAIGTVTLKVLDAKGQLQFVKLLNTGTNYVDASKLPAGVYLYKLVQGEVVTSGTIIKQ